MFLPVLVCVVSYVCMCAHLCWEYMLRLTSGSAWVQEGEAALLLSHYQIWQPLLFCSVDLVRHYLKGRYKTALHMF